MARKLTDLVVVGCVEQEDGSRTIVDCSVRARDLDVEVVQYLMEKADLAVAREQLDPAGEALGG